MVFKLSAPPTVEQHSENLLHLFTRDANGAPIPGARLKIWAGPPPTGNPAYWTDDQPYRQTGASGMFEFIIVTGPMPEDRDYWMQVIDDSGTVQSDPVQFHFPRGSTIWITAVLTKDSAGNQPHDGNTPINVDLDPRLAPMHVTIQPVNVAPGQMYWKIIAVKYQDEFESGGNHHVYFTALDEHGIPAPGVSIQMDWQGRETNDIPSSVYTDGNGTGNLAMYHGSVGWNPTSGPGPYLVWVGDPDYRGVNPTKVPGEKLVGCGLPMNRHVNFIVTWKKVMAPNDGETPSLTLEQAAITAARRFKWMPINTDGALYKFAMLKNLGYPQTDEFEFAFNNIVYLGQVYNFGIVYVKKGDWGNVQWMKKP